MQRRSRHTNTVFHRIALLTGKTLIIEPVNTVLEITLTIDQIILISTSFAVISRVLSTTLNFANSSFQLIVWETVLTDPFLIPETPWSNGLAVSFSSQIIPTLTRNTSVVIENPTIIDITMLATQSKRRITLSTCMAFSLIFTAKNVVSPTL